MCAKFNIKNLASREKMCVVLKINNTRSFAAATGDKFSYKFWLGM